MTAEENKQHLKVKNKMRRSQLIFVWSLLALPILSWCFWYLYTHIYSIIIAFQDSTGNWSLIQFKLFWESVTAADESLNSLRVGFKNTMCYFILNNAFLLPMQLVISYFLYKKVAGYRVYRVIFYFPAIISGVAFTSVFKAFIHSSGPLGEICDFLGITLPKGGLLGNEATANQTIWAYVIYTGLGGRMLIACGSMSRIPTELLEAGRLDGTTSRTELVKIVLPMISHVISAWYILAATGILTASGPVMLLAPQTDVLGTTTLSYWMFSKVYNDGSIGLSAGGAYNLVSATSLVFTLITIPIVLILRYFLEKINVVDY